MLFLAYVLCALAGGLALLMTLGARPTRGENFTAAHLVTGPIAIAFVAGAVLVQIAAPLPTTVANVVLGDGKAKLLNKATLPPAQIGTLEIAGKATGGGSTYVPVSRCVGI
mgnify:CR=1 FL=1